MLKEVIAGLVLMGVSSFCSAGEEEEVIMYSCSSRIHLLKKEFTFKVFGKEFNSTPEWREADPNPPLSPRKAIKAAEDYLSKLIPDWKKNATFERISLVQMGDSKWIYIVDYNFVNVPNQIDGPVDKLSIPVDFTGKIGHSSVEEVK